jgi:hypothetical protein
MRLKVKQASKRWVWYNDHVGEEFYVTSVNTQDVYWVRAADGYINFVYREDAELIDNETRQLQIVSCVNPILWYNNHVNEVFTITWENEKAYWVKHPVQFNAWVYKSDVRIINEVR